MHFQYSKILIYGESQKWNFIYWYKHLAPFPTHQMIPSRRLLDKAVICYGNSTVASTLAFVSIDGHKTRGKKNIKFIFMWQIYL